MKFADKLAQLRKANNLSQEQLADKLDVSRQSISKWESGDTYPDMTKLIQLCNILNCKLPDLMDDGTFDEDYVPKEKEKNGLSSYLKNFLDYVTKTYNMFIHMPTKSKFICLIEMLLIGLAFAIIVDLFPEIVNGILDRLFRYVPYGYTISNVLSDICAVALAILGIIAWLHLFKIRYLDYYVTVVDNTIASQIVEEPIEENATVSALDDKQKKEKVVIRDPKHSISHFLDGIAKIFIFIFKAFVIMCSIPSIIWALGTTYLSTIMFSNVKYSCVFTFAGISLAGCALIGFLFVYVAINYIFKRKQPVVVLITLFLSSLLLIGVGAGLATDKALNLNIVDSDYQINYDTKTYNYLDEDIKDGLLLEFNCYDIEKVIDDTKLGVTVEIQVPNDINVVSDEFVDLEYENNVVSTNGRKGVYFNFGYAKGIVYELNKLKTDIKNGYIRQDYGGLHKLVKVKVIMSQETSDKVQIINW